MEFLGISPDGRAGPIRGGEQAQIVIPFEATRPIGQDINFQVQIGDDSLPMDWAAFKDDLNMDHIPSGAWDAIYANFTANVGDTVGSYHDVLADDATYLSQLGQPTPYIARLLPYELNKAGGVFTTRTLMTVTDANTPAPGLALMFVRQFQLALKQA